MQTTPHPIEEFDVMDEMIFELYDNQADLLHQSALQSIHSNPPPGFDSLGQEIARMPLFEPPREVVAPVMRENSSFSHSSSSSHMFSDKFVDSHVVANPQQLSTLVKRRGEDNVFDNTSVLYCPHRYFFYHKFEKGFLRNEFLHKYKNIYVQVHVLIASTGQEALKNQRPIITCAPMSTVSCNPFNQIFDHSVKFQLMDCSYHNSNHAFLLRVSYKFAPEGQPFLVRDSPQFLIKARNPSRRTGGQKRVQQKGNEEPSKKRKKLALGKEGESQSTQPPEMKHNQLPDEGNVEKQQPFRDFEDFKSRFEKLLALVDTLQEKDKISAVEFMSNYLKNMQEANQEPELPLYFLQDGLEILSFDLP